ncbi:hypothetical protein JTB14_018057, partial [Gonioctena quinquepunctata]
GGANLTKFRISGLSGLVASSINANIFTKSVNITVIIPDLLVTFNYWLDLVVGELIPLYGSGPNSLSFGDIELQVAGKLDNNNKLVNKTGVLSIGSGTFNFNGLINNTEFTSLVNTVLNDNFCDFVDDYSALISEILGVLLNSS